MLSDIASSSTTYLCFSRLNAPYGAPRFLTPNQVYAGGHHRRVLMHLMVLRAFLRAAVGIMMSVLNSLNAPYGAPYFLTLHDQRLLGQEG